jgi:prolyl-tRNA synthetase
MSELVAAVEEVEPTVAVQEPDNVVVAMLSALSLQPTMYSHKAAFNIEEQDKYVSIGKGLKTKNLFLKDKKHGLFLLTVPHDREVNMKALPGMLSLTGAAFRMADEETLTARLGVIRGAVSPFAVMNDTEGAVTMCLDKALLDADFMNVHPLRNDRTVSISPDDLLAFLQHVKHEPKILDFSAAPAVAAPVAKAAKAAKPAKAAKEPKAAAGGEEGGRKKETLLGISATKEDDFALWYTQVITLSEMIDYSDISGCYILRPWSYSIWEHIQRWFDDEIKELEVQNSYFPMFVSKHALETEASHVEGFAPEVAWVTRSGTTELAEPIAVRPTSETIMYPFFAKWIRSHRDLPLKLNQWNNVVRWEFKDATPFLRSREFLWQEGHTAHTSYEEAQQMVLVALDLYRQVYEDLLAVPVIKGMKTEKEKFAGGEHTTTVEAYIDGSGRAIQAATSHNLGQNFGKMFKIGYEDTNAERQIPWQTSWGLTTRSIGVAVMVHGDNKGLVLPPRVAPVQVVLVPIYIKDTPGDMASLLAYTTEIKKTLKAAGVRVTLDDRQNITPGWKFNHWEQKGVPLRLEVGPRDMASGQCRVVRRDNGEKADLSASNLGTVIPELLRTVHTDMFNRAKAKRDEKMCQVTTWADFMTALEKNCLVLTPFCDQEEWEEKVKVMSREESLRGEAEEATCAVSVAAKTLCKPFDQPELPAGTPCFVSGLPATTWVLWGRSY